MKPSEPRLFYDLDPVDGLTALVRKFGPNAFASPYRSTVPLVSLACGEWPLLERIAAACGCTTASAAHFECSVSPPGVEGNPSQADLLIRSSARTLAIEAKWTEPRYETVLQRFKRRVIKLADGDPEEEEHQREHQRAIIESWLGLLAPHANAPLGLEKVENVVYQMLHRAASACAAGSNPALAYVYFEPAPGGSAATADRYRADLRHLRGILGKPATFPFYLVTVPLMPTPMFAGIGTLPKGKEATDRKVREAIGEGGLFRFGQPRIEEIE